MSLIDWAKKEVDIACKSKNSNRKIGGYESALKAFESLCNDGHSGVSIKITQNILNRLIDGKPLTPIEDVDDVWESAYVRNDGTKSYQCKRMSSLFKRVHPDGSITYNNNNRYVAVDIDNINCGYHANYIDVIMDEIIGPITMPYIPEPKPYYVFCEDFLFDYNNGDFDTVGLLFYKDQDGNKIELNIYLAEKDNEFVRITEKEYLNRKEVAKNKGEKIK